jgi:hypothetical protein
VQRSGAILEGAQDAHRDLGLVQLGIECFEIGNA